MPDVPVVLAKPGLVSPLWIASLRPRPLEALKGLNDWKELRWCDGEPYLVIVLSCLLLESSVTRVISLIVTIDAPQMIEVALTPMS